MILLQFIELLLSPGSEYKVNYFHTVCLHDCLSQERQLCGSRKDLDHWKRETWRFGHHQLEYSSSYSSAISVGLSVSYARCKASYMRAAGCS